MGYAVRYVTKEDCLVVAEPFERQRVNGDDRLLRELAERWCDMFGYRLGGYLGWGKRTKEHWDVWTQIKP